MTVEQIVDILGEVETLAQTPFDELEGPFGVVRLTSPEDLLVERVLVSVYPQPPNSLKNQAWTERLA
jgi:hypothetical protein